MRVSLVVMQTVAPEVKPVVMINVRRFGNHADANFIRINSWSRANGIEARVHAHYFLRWRRLLKINFGAHVPREIFRRALPIHVLGIRAEIMSNHFPVASAQNTGTIMS